jgi:hypothetical protein
MAIFYSTFPWFEKFDAKIHKKKRTIRIEYFIAKRLRTDLFSPFFASKSIEWFIEDQSFSPCYDLAPYSPPPSPSPVSSLSPPVCRQSSLLTEEGESGWGRSQIIRMRESLVLYKSFNTLWVLDLMNRTRICHVEGPCAKFGHSPTLLRLTL